MVRDGEGALRLFSVFILPSKWWVFRKCVEGDNGGDVALQVSL